MHVMHLHAYMPEKEAVMHRLCSENLCIIQIFNAQQTITIHKTCTTV